MHAISWHTPQTWIIIMMMYGLIHLVSGAILKSSFNGHYELQRFDASIAVMALVEGTLGHLMCVFALPQPMRYGGEQFDLRIQCTICILASIPFGWRVIHERRLIKNGQISADATARDW